MKQCRALRQVRSSSPRTTLLARRPFRGPPDAILKCGSVVVFPEHAGGLHNQPEGGRRYGDDVRYEEFFYDRLEPNVTIYRPDSVDDLADAVAFLRSHDEFAREVGRRSQAFALRELGADAALCYWAALVAEVARLQDRGDRLARCCPDG